MLIEVYLKSDLVLHPFLNYQQPAGLAKPSIGDLLIFEDVPYELVRREYVFSRDLKTITARYIVEEVK